MNIRISGLVNDSIVDGPGLRFTVFTQGCPHHCEGCHNPQTHDFEGGRLVDTADIIGKIAENPLLSGVTLSGGEPFAQPLPCLEIARATRALGLNVWIYSGYAFEQLTNTHRDDWAALLRCCDILVDGKFVLAERTLSAPYRGSKNQRLIDLNASLAEGRVVEARA